MILQGSFNEHCLLSFSITQNYEIIDATLARE